MNAAALICYALAADRDPDVAMRAQPNECLLTQSSKRTVEALMLGDRAWELTKSLDVLPPVRFLTRPFPWSGLVRVKAVVFEWHELIDDDVRPEDREYGPCFCAFDAAMSVHQLAVDLWEAENDAEGDEGDDSDEDAPPRKRKRKRPRPPKVGAGPCADEPCHSPMIWIGFIVSIELPPRVLIQPERMTKLFHQMTRDAYREWNEEVGPLWNSPRAVEALSALKAPDVRLFERMQELIKNPNPPLPAQHALLSLSVKALPANPNDRRELLAVVPKAKKAPSVEQALQLWLYWKTLPGVEPWGFWDWVISHDLSFAAAVISLMRTEVGNHFSEMSRLATAMEALSIRPGVWRVTNDDADPHALSFLSTLNAIMVTDSSVKVDSLVIARGIDQSPLGAPELALWREFCLCEHRADVKIIPEPWKDERRMGDLLAAMAKKPPGYCALVSTCPSVTAYLQQVMAARSVDLRVQDRQNVSIEALSVVPCLILAGAHVRNTARFVRQLLESRQNFASVRDQKGQHATFILGDQFLAQPLGNTAWAAWCHAIAPNAVIPESADLPAPTLRRAPKGVYSAKAHVRGMNWVGDIPFYSEESCAVVYEHSAWLRYAMELLRPINVVYVGEAE